MIEITKEYVNFFRGNMEFPREALYTFPEKEKCKRPSLEDEVDFVDYFNQRNDTDCYIQIFSKRQINRSEFDTIYLDVDSHEKADSYRDQVSKAHKIFLKMYESIIKSGVMPSRCYFTGRGFALYLDFPETKFINRKEYSDAVRSYVSHIGMADFVDRNPLGDVSRVVRFPNTKNGNTDGQYCIRIHPEWDLDMIIENSKKNQNYDGRFVRDNKILNILKEAATLGDCNNGEFTKAERKPEFGADTKYTEFPKCMRNFYEEIMVSGELDHYERVNLAIFMLKIWGKDRAKKVISYANDYKEHTTEYQLNWLVDRKMQMYSCKRFKSDGLCPFDRLHDCVYYKRSNGWLERIVPEYSETNK